MVKVFLIEPACGGFGAFQLACESQLFDFDSVSDNAHHVAIENHNVKAFMLYSEIDQAASWDDQEQAAEMAAALRAAHGNAQGGHSELVIFDMGAGCADGAGLIESVDVV